ncbi:uncharacterized protein LOC133816242 [Humulus lupulus]|uniref:uncharacterized protein LOC133816242 n=1 Tax=Humulus lupulus TaxID=3486 RepID=UPI002B400BAE|nr:uncharacterized protein LOC133816242 [Humulus lupulus]
MKWEENKMVEYEMVSHLCSFRNSPPWFLLLVPVLLILVGLVFGLKLFFSTLLIITSTIIYLFALYIISKPKAVLVQSLVPPQKDNVQILEDQTNQDIITSSSNSTTTTPYPNSPDDLQSESEFLDHQSSTTDDSQVLDDQWPYRNDMNNIVKRQWRHTDFSDDGSISDEESLIEISLPSGHYVDHHHDHDHQNHKEDLEPMSFNLHHQKSNIMGKDLFPDASCNIFRERSLMELLAEINEMNEEENLIEIDISMGSIKCSRFEIQA